MIGYLIAAVIAGGIGLGLLAASLLRVSSDADDIARRARIDEAEAADAIYGPDVLPGNVEIRKGRP